MVQLNYLEELKAIRACVQKPRYHVGVFTRTIQDSMNICSEMIDAIHEDTKEEDALERYANAQVNRCILFKNGSYIEFVVANQNARGHKFHHILYGQNIKHDILYTVVHATKMRYDESRNNGGNNGSSR